MGDASSARIAGVLPFCIHLHPLLADEQAIQGFG